MFFDHLTLAPQEGLFETYLRFLGDARDDKVNLSIGMYYNNEGVVPLFSAVKKAESEIASEELSRTYQPMGGHKGFQESFSKLVLGDKLFNSHKSRLCMYQTIGATGALSIMGTLLADSLCDTIYLSDPTWSNHKTLFGNAGLKLLSYPYLDKETNFLKMDALLEKLAVIPKGSTLLLHTCCHNPTGVDPSKKEWDQILSIVIERGLFPIFDTAYQGLSESIDDDVYPIRYMAENNAEFACTVSASKNFGLYGERIGLLMICTDSVGGKEKVDSRLKGIIRANYSNPPIHGAAIVDKILTDPALRLDWERELKDVKLRLSSNRNLLYKHLQKELADKDYAFIASHKGMFSLLGLNPEKVRTLEEKGFYLAPSGRINIAGVSEVNVDSFAKAMREVVYNR